MLKNAFFAWKSEARNPKQYQMTKMPIFKTKIRSSSGFGPLLFR